MRVIAFTCMCASDQKERDCAVCFLGHDGHRGSADDLSGVIKRERWL